MSLPFRVLHVGGRGDIDSLSPLKIFGSALEITVCEADASAQPIASVHRSVCACLGDHAGPATFHVTWNPQASSIFLMEPRMAGWTFGGRTWRQEAELDHDIELQMTTVDRLVEQGTIAAPHLLSLDAQGAEFLILKGAARALRDSVVAVVAECEFQPIYAGQGLFHDQVEFLAGFGFCFQQLLTRQVWRPPDGREPVDVVGEALYLRWDPCWSWSDERAIHVLDCASAFGMNEFANRLTDTYFGGRRVFSR